MLKTIPEEISNTTDELIIRWKDGRECRYSLLMLRRQCPCANCRGGHDAGAVRTTGNITEISLESIQKVGRYALKLRWSDNHDDGIYSYDTLRATCDRGGDYE